MNRIRQLFARWKRGSDDDDRTFAAAAGSLAVTAVFALYNGFLGIYLSSLWYGTICVYYIVLAVFRGMIISAIKKVARKSNPERFRKRVYFASAALLLFLNICLVVPVSLLVIRMKPVNMSLIPAIGMAAYTTYKVIMSSVNLKRIKKSSDSLLKMLRTVSFIEALVSVLTLQNTLIMVNSKGDGSEMLAISALSSLAIMLAVLALSAAAMKKGVSDLKRKD